MTGQSSRSVLDLDITGDPGHMGHCMNPVGYPAGNSTFVPRSLVGEDQDGEEQ